MNLKHGLIRHELYGIWAGMRKRCLNPNCKSYKNYGGRGIKICKRWDNFGLFVKDMDERPKGYTIERINNDGNYCPENCKWVSPSKQGCNQRQRRDWHIKGRIYKTATSAAIHLNVGRVTIWRWCKNRTDCYSISLF